MRQMLPQHLLSHETNVSVLDVGTHHAAGPVIQLGVVRHHAGDLVLDVGAEQAAELATPGLLPLPLVLLGDGHAAPHVTRHVAHDGLTTRATCHRLIVTRGRSVTVRHNCLGGFGEY